MLFSGTEIATMAVALIAGSYGLRGQRAASRATAEAAKATANANLEVARMQAELQQREAVHREAAGIWADATKWREEQGRIIEGLRAELEREQRRSQAREKELVGRIEALEKWKATTQPQIDMACDVLDCDRRRRPGKD